MTTNRADRRVDDGRVRAEPGLHRVSAALVVPLLADHGADEGDVAQLLGRALEAGSDLDTFDCGPDRPGARGDVGARMRVERLELTWPALRPEHEDRRGGFARLLGRPGEEVTDRCEPGDAGQAGEVEKAATVRGMARQWFHENSVELIIAQNRSSSR